MCSIWSSHDASTTEAHCTTGNIQLPPITPTDCFIHIIHATTVNNKWWPWRDISNIFFFFFCYRKFEIALDQNSLGEGGKWAHFFFGPRPRPPWVRHWGHRPCTWLNLTQPETDSSAQDLWNCVQVSNIIRVCSCSLVLGIVAYVTSWLRLELSVHGWLNILEWRIEVTPSVHTAFFVQPC